MSDRNTAAAPEGGAATASEAGAPDPARVPAPVPGSIPALAISGIGHSFGRRVALADVSLTVPQGRFVALLGPNGAGKTTLFALATRLYTTRQGDIAIFGQDLARAASAALAELGVVFQSRTLDLDLTVRQNLVYHAALHGLSGRPVRARIASLMEMVGLADRLDEKVRILSGGQSRRVEIARALLHGPRLLLLDEPTVGLDLAARRSIVALVRSLVEREKLAVLWSTHIFDEVESEDSVYVLNRGRIIASGRACDIARAGAAPSLEAAFRAMTETEGEAA